jgi:alpha-D-xyloside xylohydrolase
MVKKINIMIKKLFYVFVSCFFVAGYVMAEKENNDYTYRCSIKNNKLVYYYKGERIIIEGWGQDGLRIRVIPDGGGQTSNWALSIPSQSKAEIEISDKRAILRNGKISVQISDIFVQEGFMQFFKHSGNNKVPILSEHDYVVWAHNPGTRSFIPAGDSLFHTELHLASCDGERFYGMGQNATRKLNLKGCVIDLYQRHVKQVVPFVVSSEGYGFLWNNPSLGRVEFGNNMTRWISYGCRQMDYYITAGDSYADIMEHYADVTGHAPEFPYWASGFWQCKLRYKSQEEFLNVAREFKKRELPLSVFVIDFLHWKHIGDWKLDPEYWPEPEAMVQELDKMGVRIMISPWILVNENSENFSYMKENDLFTSSIDNKYNTVSWPLEKGHTYQYDPTNPEAARFLWGKWKENYFDIGIRTFWLDPADDFHEIEEYDKVLYHIGPATEAHCYYPVAHQKNIYEGLIEAGENEIITICRSAWAGSQRYGACPATHDIFSSFEHLNQYMKAGLNVSMSGIPWWCTDIGGFITPNELRNSPEFHELMVRWYQYAVFTPVFRTHGARQENEPWNIGGDSYRHIRAAMFLRERLRPYVMEQMKLAHQKGLPPMRPVFFDFEDDPNTTMLEDQFLFGPDLLIAPITEYKARERDVYLPDGSEWTDAWSGKKIAGGQVVKAQAPIEHIPVFVRGNNQQLLQLFKNLYEE